MNRTTHNRVAKLEARQRQPNAKHGSRGTEMSAVATRLRKLEAKRPSGLCALSDEELNARIGAGMAALLAVYGSVDAIAASYRADGNEPAARLVEGYRERTI